MPPSLPPFPSPIHLTGLSTPPKKKEAAVAYWIQGPLESLLPLFKFMAKRIIFFPDRIQSEISLIYRKDSKSKQVGQNANK